MKKLKYGIYKILKALDQPTESLQDTTSMTDPTSARLHDPSAPVVKTAALRKGGSSSASATANSLFFNLLPIELRLRILDASFGGRTLHIGYGAPQVVPYSQYQPKASLSGGEHCAWRPRRISKSAKSWVGCVCHRLSGDDDFGLRLVHDTCLDGDADCWAWEGEIPHKCWLGVMGWLLTCRQAYVQTLQDVGCCPQPANVCLILVPGIGRVLTSSSTTIHSISIQTIAQNGQQIRVRRSGPSNRSSLLPLPVNLALRPPRPKTLCKWYRSCFRN